MKALIRYDQPLRVALEPEGRNGKPLLSQFLGNGTMKTPSRIDILERRANDLHGLIRYMQGEICEVCNDADNGDLGVDAVVEKLKNILTTVQDYDK